MRRRRRREKIILHKSCKGRKLYRTDWYQNSLKMEFLQLH